MGSGKMKLDWSWPARSGIFWFGCHGLTCASPGFNVVPFWLSLLASLANPPPLRQASCLKCPPPPPSPPLCQASCLKCHPPPPPPLHHPAPGVFDLLNIRSKKDLPVKWDAGQGFYVPGLKNVPCGDLNSMMEVSAGRRGKMVV